MNVKILKNPKTENYFSLKNSILGQNMQWRYQANSVDTLVSHPGVETPFYIHNVLERSEKMENGDDGIRSSGFSFFKDVLEEILEFNGIKYEKFLRICVNSCHKTNLFRQSPIHVDHQFEHQQMLIYLTNSDAVTNIYKEKFSKDVDLSYDDLNRIIRISPYEDEIVVFDGLHYHSYDYPDEDNSRRIVIVCTFC